MRKKESSYTRALALRIAALAKDKLASKVVVLDIQKVDAFCAFFVILTATSCRHTNALAQAIEEELLKEDIHPHVKAPVNDESGWIVLDYSAVVVHIFTKETRELYALERLWSDAKKIRVPKG